MIKSAKEAREIIKKAHTTGSIFLCDDPGTFNMDKELGRAEGYIAGMEDPAVKGLVEALEKIAMFNTPVFNGERIYTINPGMSGSERIAVEAIATYHTAIKGRQGE